MNKAQKTSLLLGVLLVVLGGLFIAANLVPGLQPLLAQLNSWPMIIEAVALGLLLLGLVIGTPEMAVPAMIVGGIGAILWWQSATGNWESWAYMWTLIPGLSALGVLLSKLLGGSEKSNVWHTLDTVGTSLILFVIFGAFFGGFKFMGPYWPLLLIAAGLLMGIRTFFRNR